eukprot:scaffold89628_cov32-Tisochrysis_lutea.AAC.4
MFENPASTAFNIHAWAMWLIAQTIESCEPHEEGAPNRRCIGRRPELRVVESMVDDGSKS